jgi:hypothetical protein
VGGHPVVRALAGLAPYLDYPGGIIGERYGAAEWLDCDCHRDSDERRASDELERRLQAAVPLDATPELLAVLAEGNLGAH